MLNSCIAPCFHAAERMTAAALQQALAAKVWELWSHEKQGEEQRVRVQCRQRGGQFKQGVGEARHRAEVQGLSCQQESGASVQGLNEEKEGGVEASPAAAATTAVEHSVEEPSESTVFAPSRQTQIRHKKRHKKRTYESAFITSVPAG